MNRNEQNYIIDNRYQLRVFPSKYVSESFKNTFTILHWCLLPLTVLCFPFQLIIKIYMNLIIITNSYLPSALKLDNQGLDELIKNPVFYIQCIFFFMVVWILCSSYFYISKICLKLIKFENLFVDSNPNFKPFKYFKGEFLIPENRDSSDYGIRYKLLQIVNLKICIEDVIRDEKNNDIYKIKIMQNNNELETLEVNELDLAYYTQGFKLG